MRKAWIIAFMFPMAGCDVNESIKGMGNYMPTISDDRCYSDECITPEGRAESDKVKAERMRGSKQTAPKNARQESESNFTDSIHLF